MGSSTSKFRKHLQNGDEVAALHLYNNNADLRKGLDPNCSYGDSHQHETPLHYVSRHGMKSLLRIFLKEHNGNPNKTNGRKETCLHCVCMEKTANVQFYPVQRKRAECLSLIMSWRGAELKDGQQEKADLGAQDENENTALHYAASSGLKHCVEMLVQQGAPLFSENKDEQTPCDLAEKGGHSEIALYLESKMVFSSDENTDENEEILPPVESEDYSGLRAQDLQEAKDQLLVETADMLSVPLFTAEALLRSHEWSREMLLEAWMTDPLSCCERSGVTPPQSLFCDKPQVQEHLNSPTSSVPPSPDAVCDICTHSFALQEEPVHMSCKHQFCRMCWKEYLNLKIQEGDAHHITCPGFNCSRLVPVDVIENIVSMEMARRYLQFDIKAFVESNPNIKWCPFPGCGRAVKLPEIDNSNQAAVKKLPSDTSRAVDCGNGHYFCWDCIGEAHEPSSCENWKRWHQKIAEVKPEELHGTDSDTESAANCLWLVTNSKACPNCKSPIQKNEGCNHMKCSKCKYDFCWVCLDQWKRHNSSTGGYFKCNRYEVVKKVEDTAQQMKTEANEKNQKMQELNKFVHYYTRFKNHENSYKLELPLLNTTKDKMMKLAEAVTDPATANAETRFVEDAVHQLLRARRVLKCSYVYGYYLDGPGYKKIVFECMQTELEECTEILSQMVNRLYLRTPRKRIIEQAHICHRKRHEFIVAISKGLVPPETPPSLRKHRRRRYSMDNEDEELRKAILASIQEVDPANPWIKDASGRHTNVTAVLDWPDSDDSDTEIPTTLIKLNGTCARENCNKPRAKNPRTGEWHEHCSKQCMYADQLDSTQQSEPVQEVIMDEQMDLLRALEMSRLQYLRDQGIIAEISDQDKNSSCTDLTTAAEGGSNVSEKSQIEDTTKTVSKPKLTAMEELDLELQRVLEISAISPSDLDMPRPKSTSNIESHRLDLPTGGIDPLSSHESLELPTTPKFRKSRFDEDTSMVVNRVPNKSVEDVKHAGEHVQPHFQLPLQLPDVLDNTRQQTWDLGDLNVTSGNSSHSSHTGSCFGVIKDLSVSNIHVDEEDKTKDFQSKNLNLLMHETRHHNNSRGVLAANTPDEDSNAFLFMSPADSDPSGYTDSRNQPPSSRHQAWGGQEQAWGGSEQAWGGHQQSCSDQPKFEDKVESWYNRTDDLHSNLVGSRHDDHCGHPYSSGNDLLQMAENLVQMTSAMQTELTTSSGAVGSKQTDSVKHPPLLQTDNDTYDKRSNISHQQTIGLYPVHGSAGQTDLSDWSFQKVDHTYDQSKETSNIESDPFDNSAQDQTKYDSDIGQHINYTELLSNLCSSGIEAESSDQTSVDDITCSSSNIQDVENEDFTVSNSGALSDSNNTEDDIFTGRGQCDETVGPSQNNVNQGEIEDQVEDNNDDGVSSQDLVFPSSFLQQLTGQFGDLQEDDNPGYFV